MIVITRNGIADSSTKRSASSRPKYLGINSPNNRIRDDEIRSMVSSSSPKIFKRKTELSEAKVILTILLEMRIDEKNISGLFIKYLAFFADKLFFLARTSILILFDTMKAISEEAKKALSIKSTSKVIRSFVIIYLRKTSIFYKNKL